MATDAGQSLAIVTRDLAALNEALAEAIPATQGMLEECRGNVLAAGSNREAATGLRIEDTAIDGVASGLDPAGQAAPAKAIRAAAALRRAIGTLNEAVGRARSACDEIERVNTKLITTFNTAMDLMGELRRGVSEHQARVTAAQRAPAADAASTVDDLAAWIRPKGTWMNTHNAFYVELHAASFTGSVSAPHNDRITACVMAILAVESATNELGASAPRAAATLHAIASQR